MRGIKRRAFIYGFLTTLLLFGLALFVTFRTATLILIDNLDRSVMLLSQESAEIIHLQLSKNVTNLTLVTQLPEINSLTLEESLKHLPSIRDILGFSELALVDTQGFAHYPDGLVLDLSDRKYIQTSLLGNPTISDPLISRVSGELVIIVAVPLYSNSQEVVGVLMGRIDAGVLQTLVDTKGYGSEGYAYIIHQNGSILAHPNKSFVQTPPLTVTQLVQNFPQYQDFYHFFTIAQHTLEGVGSYDLQGQKLRFGYTLVPETEWILFVGASEAEILASLFNLQQIILIVAFFFTLLLIVGLYRFLGSFLQPALDLEQLFLKAAQGSLHLRASGNYPNEFARLANSFNSLLDTIQSLTYYDALTGLPNVRTGLGQLGTLMGISTNQKVFALVLSIDRFQSIHEVSGYTAGDWLLQQVAIRLQLARVKADLAFRANGNDFVVVFTCPDSTSFYENPFKFLEEALSDPYELTDKEVISKLKHPHAGAKTFQITFSFGLAYYPDHGASQVELLEHASVAMAIAKELGGNKVQEFSHEMFLERSYRYKIETDLSTAITSEQFYLVYQPIRVLRTGKLQGLEALIRWNHPELGFIAPDLFISLAEKVGYIQIISSWVIETTCKQIRTWTDQGIQTPPISINLSSQEFEHPLLLETLLTTLEKYQLPPSAIKIEITERTVIQQIEQGKEKIDLLQNHGIKVALDDFGIGYSSLNYLVSLPVSTIKIDKSFIMEIHKNPQSKAIVLGLLGMAHNLNIKVVCEGIETSDQFQWLLHQTADLGQGYFISRPKKPQDPELLNMLEL